MGLNGFDKGLNQSSDSDFFLMGLTVGCFFFFFLVVLMVGEASVDGLGFIIFWWC